MDEDGMPTFTFDDTVRVREDAPVELRPGVLASVVMVFTEEERIGDYFKTFPPGTVYSIEFEDGTSVEIHESLVEKGAFRVYSPSAGNAASR